MIVNWIRQAAQPVNDSCLSTAQVEAVFKAHPLYPRELLESNVKVLRWVGEVFFYIVIKLCVPYNYSRSS